MNRRQGPGGPGPRTSAPLHDARQVRRRRFWALRRPSPFGDGRGWTFLPSHRARIFPTPLGRGAAAFFIADRLPEWPQRRRSSREDGKRRPIGAAADPEAHQTLVVVRRRLKRRNRPRSDARDASLRLSCRRELPGESVEDKGRVAQRIVEGTFSVHPDVTRVTRRDRSWTEVLGVVVHDDRARLSSSVRPSRDSGHEAPGICTA